MTSNFLNKDVIDYLNYYFSENTTTDFAILLNGSWGSGKTYFIKNSILNETNRLINPLNITLNGVASISEITDQFFSLLYPRLSSKSVRMLGVITSRAINGFVGTDVAKDNNDKTLIKDIFIDVKNRIIIFDDLERCLIPIASVLGYINSFVEHERCKVLIVASENDISKDQLNDYLLKKEKTIGKTISFIPPISDVIDFFTQSMINPLAKGTIKNNIKDVLNLINDSLSVNFRSIRSIFNDFERVVTNLEIYIGNSNMPLVKLLMSMLAIGIEYKAGNISALEMANLPTNSLSYSLSKSNDIRADIIEKYSTVDWFDPIIPYCYIAQIFETGIVDIENIKIHLSQHPLITCKNNILYWRELWAWNELTRSNYLKARDGLKLQLKNFELVEPEVILHVVGIALSLEDNNDNSLTSEIKVVPFFTNYIEFIKNDDLLLPDISYFNDSHHSKYNLGMISSDKNEFKEVKQYLKSAVIYRFNKTIKKSYPNFLYKMSHESAEYKRLYEYDLKEGNYGGFPFLHLIPVGYFAHMLISDWKCNGLLLSSLLERYSRDQNYKNLTEEYVWIKKLKTMAYRIIEKAEEPHKTLLKNRLDYYFDLIEQKIH
ncbi:hypothetical protein CWI88_00530 [Enterobacter cancerogenus]|uniref:P-loop NTPase fold protein n=1 Tax=Enterobacter cancerogenus TaxID=69218 RepID=UPI000C770CB9|nr:P-loop NTPase fold protein [Enterobacter cancerogenus]AUJ79620.1 hypothetical protein CWI88_00530 [Enterobacter cancerogenus]